MTFPYDEFESLSIGSDFEYSRTTRKAWDCYEINSASLWLDIDDDGAATVDTFNHQMKRDRVRHFMFHVRPSYAQFRLYYPSVWVFDYNIARDAILEFLEDNIGWFNVVKSNDIRDPLECPPLVLNYSDRG